MSLCDTDHTNLHLIAKRLHAKKQFSDILVGCSEERARKLVWLGTKAYQAEKLFGDDSNKMLQSSVRLTKADAEMMKRLQTVLSKSRNDILIMGLRLLYQSKLGIRDF